MNKRSSIITIVEILGILFFSNLIHYIFYGQIIDGDYLKEVILPIIVIIIIFNTFAYHKFTSVITMALIVGIFVMEYTQKTNSMRGTPNMAGGFRFIFILTSGALIGIVLQIISGRKKNN